MKATRITQECSASCATQAASRLRRMASGEAFNAALRLGAAQAVATDRQTNVASKPPVPGDHPDGAIEYAPPARSPKKPPKVRAL